ncbi:TRAP transporter large permease [Bacillus sp. Marseille-P3661]|uniref:TRAP transporter large permease n=1 Tax=Bacillus sp. Marseille-P3661 TaxID=1936234 RepID=UPI000C826F4E|nr:TRAP transporter large permease [Bacillus sp. Marseille-P3661]
MIAITLFSLLIILLLINLPIGISLLTAATVTIFIFDGFASLSMVTDIMYASVAKFTLLAIPFFILAGVIMEQAGISKRLIHFANVCVGHRKSGIAMVTVFTAIFFAAISGSGPATVAALGGILIPALLKNGYSAPSAAGLLASSGSIGIVIPPSIAFIVFAVVAGDQIPVSIGRLFVAGIVPGLLMGLGFLVAAIFIKNRYEKKSKVNNQAAITIDSEIQLQQKATPREIFKAFIDAFWGLLIPVIILGGIYGGVFTPTEAAVVAVFYGLFVGIFIYKELKLKHMIDIIVSSGVQTAVVMFIVSSASVFAYIITKEQIATDISNSLLNISDNSIIILLVINIILLIAGAFIDAISAFYLFVPILLPVILELGIDPTVFGVFMTINLAIGLFTPPVGVNLYVASGIAKISLKEISIGTLPFIIAAIIVLIIVTYVPAVSVWLPNLLKM